MIALFFNKYGLFGNDAYRAAIDDMLATEIDPPALDQIAWNYHDGLVNVEPNSKVEDLLLPLTVIAARAANSEEIGQALSDRYDELIDSGAIRFDETDLPY